MIEEWNQGYAPRIAECDMFNEPLIYEDSGGTTHYLACPEAGIIYAPPLTAAALLELLFPDSWSIIPPG